jgi:hypothetical protein
MFKPYLFKPYPGKWGAVPKIPPAVLAPGGARAYLAQMAVCEAFGVHLIALAAEGRGNHTVAFARQTAMYLCRLVFAMRLTEIAQCFGRDRTTVAHAIARIEEAREDARFDATLGVIEALLHDTASDDERREHGGFHGKQ